MARLLHRSLSKDNEVVATHITPLGAAVASLQAWHSQSITGQGPTNWCRDHPLPSETIPRHIPISSSSSIPHSSSATTARHPQPALPNTPSNSPTIKSSRRRHWLPALRETQAGSWRWAPTQLQLHTLDSPTVPRLVLLPGCLNVPMADASHMSALVSVLLKMGSGFSHLCKNEVCVCTQTSLLSLPLVLFHLPL